MVVCIQPGRQAPRDSRVLPVPARLVVPEELSVARRAQVSAVQAVRPEELSVVREVPEELSAAGRVLPVAREVPEDTRVMPEESATDSRRSPPCDAPLRPTGQRDVKS